MGLNQFLMLVSFKFLLKSFSVWDLLAVLSDLETSPGFSLMLALKAVLSVLKAGALDCPGATCTLLSSSLVFFGGGLADVVALFSNDGALDNPKSLLRFRQVSPCVESVYEDRLPYLPLQG